MEIVVFTQRVEAIESYNERRDCADQRISDFIWACGYAPIPLPNDPVKVKGILSSFVPAGILLTGGNSLVKYGGNAAERDETDAFLIKEAIIKRVPLYGFCRGMQSILDYFGNELVQVTGHVAIRHGIIGKEEPIDVNSYHNQACFKLLSEELEVVMHSNDGVIEKIRHKDLPIVGTMWHPEREDPFRISDIEMVKDLFRGKEI